MKKVMTTMLITIFTLGVAVEVYAQDDMFQRMKELKAKMDMMPDTSVDKVEDQFEESDFKAPSMDKIDETEKVEEMDDSEDEMMQDIISPAKDETMEEIEETRDEALEEVTDKVVDKPWRDSFDEADAELPEIEKVEEILAPAGVDEPEAEPMAESLDEYDFDYDTMEELSAPFIDDEDTDTYMQETEQYIEDYEQQVSEEIEAADQELDEQLDDISTDTDYNLMDDMSKDMNSDVEVDYVGPVSDAGIEDFDSGLRERTDTIPAELEEIERDIEDLSIGLEEIVGKKIRDYEGN